METKEPIYIGKDFMWYAKSILEAIMIFIFIVCLIGFIISIISLCFCQKPWVNILMGWSFGIGFVNSLFIISSEKDWRVWYEDRGCLN